MARVFPIVALTERLYSVNEPSGGGEITRDASSSFRLTAAEHETMLLVARGLTNNEIASLLGVALPTIRNRIAICFEKLQVSRRTEAVYALLEASHGAAPSLVRPATLSELVHPQR